MVQKGVGFYLKSDAIQLPPLFTWWGTRRKKRRAGTENLAGIIGMGTAVSLLTSAEKASKKKTAYQSFSNDYFKKR